MRPRLLPKQRKWIARGLIGLVLFFNVQCAVVFLFQPEMFMGGFELAGVPGRMMVQGMGLLFLMWNVPYAFAVSNPLARRVSLIEAVIMQAIGVVGESLLLGTLPPEHSALRDTALRFIAFDGGGLALLLIGLWIVSSRSGLTSVDLE